MINNESVPDLSQEKSNQVSASNKIISKLTATQNVIKKKFKKALMNRLEHEENVNDTINQTSNACNATATVDASGQNEYDPNELCIKLKSLIDATNRSKDKKIHIAEIKSIIAKLTDLHIIV